MCLFRGKKYHTGFTLRLPNTGGAVLQLVHADKPLPVKEVSHLCDLKPGSFLRESGSLVLCFDLPKGKASITA